MIQDLYKYVRIISKRVGDSIRIRGFKSSSEILKIVGEEK
jgi:hypothetical protein